MKTHSFPHRPNRPLFCGILAAASLAQFALAPLSSMAQSSTPIFTRVTTGAVVTDTADHEALAWIDIDNDGWMDLFSGTGGSGPSSLYRNNGDGSFAKMTSSTAGSVIQSPGEDCAWADYDNDGFVDAFVVTDSGPNVLHHNDGHGLFSKVSAGTLLNGGTRHRAAAWGDYDGDGFADLFTSTQNRIYRNNGDGTFIRTTNAVIATSATSTSCTWIDYNNDGRPDLFASAGLDAKNYLYRNEGNGVFTRQTANDVGGVVSTPGNSAVWADYDNDGLPDVWISGAFGVAAQHLYHNDGAAGFSERTAASGLTAKPLSVTAAWGDYDNDGYIDLFIPSYPANLLYHNEHDGTFKLVTAGSVITDAALYRENYSCAWADYDNDGFLDLAVSSTFSSIAAPNFLYRNEGNSNAWLKVRCVGTVSNRAAIGAKVHIRATIGNKTFWQLREISGGGGYGSQNLLASFGLGDASRIELLRIEWPSGIVQEIKDIAPRQQITIYEPSRMEPSDSSTTNTIRGRKGALYRLEKSVDLRNWSAVGTALNTNGTVTIGEVEGSASSLAFYRSVEALIPQDASYGGLSISEWTIRWWQWTYATFSSTNRGQPFDQSGTNFLRGQSGPVWFLAFPDNPVTVRDVTVPAGKALLFPCTAFDSLFASLSGNPINSLAEFKPMAEAWSHTVNPGVEIDGLRIERLVTNIVVSGPFTVTLPADNVQGLSPGDHYPEFQAGYWFFLAPLPVGEHTIHFFWDNAGGPFAPHYDETYHVHVSPE